MYSHCAFLIFANIQKLVDYICGRGGSIGEEKIVVLYSRLHKIISLVSFIIEPDHHGNSELFEDGDVVGGSEEAILNRK